MIEIHEYEQQTASNLAQNIYYLRKSRSLTQKRLSELAGIPRSTITNFESGSGNPSLNNLVRIAKALEVQVDELLAPAVAKTSLIRKDEIPYKVKERSRIFNLLPTPIKGLAMERFELEADSGFTGVPHLKGTKEYFSCIEGKAQVTIADEKFIVNKGDVLIFSGDEKHSYKNLLASSKTLAISVLVGQRD